MNIEKGKALKIIAVSVLLIASTFGLLGTWGMLASVVDGQTQIVEQQNALLEAIQKMVQIYYFGEGHDDTTQVNLEIHGEIWHWDSSGNLIEYAHHPATLTTIGLNWLEDQIGDSPATAPANYIACSDDAGSPSSAWTELPNEIVTNGLTRNTGDYANVGDGSWNMTESFSVTGTQSLQLVGLHWGAGASTLLCSDEITQINAQNGDTVQIRFSITVT